jgi:hypothetical protein
MGIRLKRIDGTFRTTVTYWIQGANGKSEEQSYVGEFKRMDLDEVKELRDSGKPDLELLLEVLVGWKASEVGSKEEVPFSPEIVRQVATEYPGFAGCSVLRFLETVGASRQKN